MNSSNFVLIFAIFVLFQTVYSGDTCTPVINGVPGFNDVCPDKEPYCVNPAGDNNFQCSQCLSGCDCNFDEFCSSNTVAKTQGQCIKFSKAGDDCRPYSTGQLQSNKYADDQKCAITYTDQNTIQLDFIGTCIQGTCRYCDPTGSVGCGSDDGVKAPRGCIFPGKYTSLHTYYWNPGFYGTQPILVWSAIFFVMIFILVVIQVFHCIAVMRSHHH